MTLVVDRISYAITAREFTDNGYLKVPGKVARTGIQQYLASELGLTDRKPNDIVNVYRPPEEVFAQDSLASYDNADVTDDHPSDMVDSKSFKDVAVGHSISVGRQEGDFVIVDLLIKDQEAIDAITAGKSELSAGYEAEYVPEKGKTADGESYEFVQRKIRINHIALVDKARAGREARLFDKQTNQEITMNIVTLDTGKTVEVADKATAQLIQNTIDSLRKQVKDAEEKKEEAEKAKDEAEAKAEKKDEELEEEKKKSSDAAIAERVQSVIDTMDKARKIAGDEFACESMDVNTIRREAMAKARPTVDWKSKSDHYVQAAWDMEVEKKMEEDEEEEEERKKANDSHKKVGKDLKGAKTNDKAVLDEAYEKAQERKANAWKEAK